jgi:hypothetical protein
MKDKLKAIVITLALIQVSNAEVSQHIALSCGTIGFGVNYSIYSDLIGFNVGLPFFYTYDKNNHNDSITITNEFKCNIYLNANYIVLRKQNYDIAIGIAVLSNLKYLNQRTMLNAIEIDSLNGLYTDPQIGPSFEFIYRNINREKIFNIQLYPIGYYPNNKNTIKLTTGIQFNYYIKQIGK